MGIRIEITDVSMTPIKELRALASFLNELADNNRNGIEPAELPKVIGLDPADFPSAGVNAADIFGKADAGNVPSAPAIAAVAPPAIAPAVPPVISVPTVTAPPALVPAVPSAAALAPTVDKNGLPWDGRIHASTKPLNADGTWRGRRGIDDATVATVTAELRAVMAIPAPPPAADPMAAFKTAGEMGMVPNVPAVPLVPSPPVNGADTGIPAVPTAAPPVPSASVTFPQLIPMITGAIAAGALTQAKLTEVLAANGLASMPQLVHRPDLIGKVHAELFPA
jgi:hypothetical protein